MGDVERDLGLQTGASLRDRAGGATPLSHSSVSQPEALIPSAEEMAVLAQASLRWRSTSIDENGVGIDYAVEESTPVHDLRRYRELTSELTRAARTGGVDAFKDWLGSPFAEAVRKASRAKGHPFWMNAPLTAWSWAVAGCPGLVAASGIAAGTDETAQQAQPEGQEPARTPKDTRHDQ